MPVRGEDFMQVAIIDDLAVCRQEIKEYLLRYMRENYQGEEPELDIFPTDVP